MMTGDLTAEDVVRVMTKFCNLLADGRLSPREREIFGVAGHLESKLKQIACEIEPEPEPVKDLDKHQSHVLVEILCPQHLDEMQKSCLVCKNKSLKQQLKRIRDTFDLIDIPKGERYLRGDGLAAVDEEAFDDHAAAVKGVK